MKKIGLITCNEFANLYYDDLHLLHPFSKAGIELVPMVWDVPTDLNQFDLLTDVTQCKIKERRRCGVS